MCSCCCLVWMLNKAYNMIINQMWHIDFSFATASGRKRERQGVCVGVVMLRRCCNISQSSQSYNKSVMLGQSCTKGNRRQKFCTLSLAMYDCDSVAFVALCLDCNTLDSSMLFNSIGQQN